MGFDVAGVDGDLNQTWTNLSPPLPDVESLGALGYDYKNEFYEISNRFYAVFASGSASLARTVYCYSWAVGEVAWTLEFSMPLGTGGSSASWDAACDGAHVYVGWTEGTNVHTPCPPPVGGTGRFSYVLVSKGVHGSAWTPVGPTIFSHSFDLMLSGVSTALYFVMCASANEPGNVYVAGVDGGITNGAVLACGFSETFWVHGLGVSPSIGEVIIEVLDFFPGPDEVFPNPLIENFYLVNDTDQVQLFYRPRADSGVEETQVNVVLPTLSATPANVIPTHAGESFTISPSWTDNTGRVERALFAAFDAFGDNLRTVSGDGLSIRNLLGYAPLGTSGVPASFVTGNSFDPVGFYYDPVKDEYWCVYIDGGGQLNSAVTTIDCAPLRWQGETWDSGSEVALRAGQGPRPDPESFYCLATDDVLTTMPSITVLPICRGCVPCPDVSGPVFATPHPMKAAT